MDEVSNKEVKEEQGQDNSTYNKKSPFVLVVIYAVVGLLVYGAIYYFAFYKKGNTNYGNQNQSNTPTVTSKQDGSTSTTPSQTDTVITLTTEGFSPATLTVKKDALVTWKNNSGETATVNSAPHPAHTNYPPLNLGSFANGETLTLSFDKVGTYKYHNHFNSKQFGTIVVE